MFLFPQIPIQYCWFLHAISGIILLLGSITLRSFLGLAWIWYIGSFFFIQKSYQRNLLLFFTHLQLQQLQANIQSQAKEQVSFNEMKYFMTNVIHDLKMVSHRQLSIIILL